MQPTLGLGIFNCPNEDTLEFNPPELPPTNIPMRQPSDEEHPVFENEDVPFKDYVNDVSKVPANEKK